MREWPRGASGELAAVAAAEELELLPMDEPELLPMELELLPMDPRIIGCGPVAVSSQLMPIGIHATRATIGSHVAHPASR